MTDTTEKSNKPNNNLFDFATSELSQDAFLCWSLNWLGVKEDTEDPYYKYGKAMLDLFLGEYKKDTYKEVKVLKQFNKIDVLVLFKDNNDNQYALIIEDKTNTSEHNEQIKKYKEQLNDELSKRHDIKYRNLAENQIYSTYVKTGIMYTDDKFKANESTVIIDINNLHDVISKHVGLCKSDIILDYYEYLKKEINYRNGVEDSINNGEFESRITDGYGQLYFLNCLFGEPEQQYIGNSHTDPTNGKNKKVYINNIYTGTSGGSRCTQFCFWGEQFPNPILDSNVNEFHYLFWRIDCDNHKIPGRKSGKCITLKYYDENENINKKSKNSDEPSQEKREKLQSRNRRIYKALIKHTNQLQSDYPNLIFVPKEYNDDNDDVKEKLLLLIPLVELQKLDLKQRKKDMNDIQSSLINFCKENIENNESLK
ncbi:MAG: hypothetical protein HXL50_09540 [Solobacterium sp.]|nr:hypothetical protein [Solobacterium sp.]